jgi:hypothetical protein
VDSCGFWKRRFEQEKAEIAERKTEIVEMIFSSHFSFLFSVLSACSCSKSAHPDSETFSGIR